MRHFCHLDMRIFFFQIFSSQKKKFNNKIGVHCKGFLGRGVLIFQKTQTNFIIHKYISPSYKLKHDDNTWHLIRHIYIYIYISILQIEKHDVNINTLGSYALCGGYSIYSIYSIYFMLSSLVSHIESKILIVCSLPNFRNADILVFRQLQI